TCARLLPLPASGKGPGERFRAGPRPNLSPNPPLRSAEGGSEHGTPPMPTLTPNGDDEIIAAFMQEFDAAADKPAVVRQFSDQHPHRAAAFADYASGRSLINQAAVPPGPVPHSLRPGEMLGDFRVLRFVAHGGMGEIYE